MNLDQSNWIHSLIDYVINHYPFIFMSTSMYLTLPALPLCDFMLHYVDIIGIKCTIPMRCHVYNP